MSVGEGRRRALGFLTSSWWAEPPSSGTPAFWVGELFSLGLIREEGTVSWHSGDVLSYVPPYLILSAPTLHAAVVLLGRWRGVGRIVNYMLEQGKTAFPTFLQNIIKWSHERHASCWKEN